MRIPSNLDDHAKAHWRRHYKQCIANGSLTEETADAYEIVCRLWSMLVTTDHSIDSKATMKFVMAVKWYKDYAVSFGLVHKKGPPPKPPASLEDILASMKRTHATEDEEGQADELTGPEESDR